MTDFIFLWQIFNSLNDNSSAVILSPFGYNNGYNHYWETGRFHNQGVKGHTVAVVIGPGPLHQDISYITSLSICNCRWIVSVSGRYFIETSDLVL